MKIFKDLKQALPSSNKSETLKKIEIKPLSKVVISSLIKNLICNEIATLK